LAPLGPLPRGSKIDEVGHAKLGDHQICGLAILALVWNNYADTVTLDHSNRQPKGSQFQVAAEECGYTGCVGQDTVA
jgi:hypothetical protein